MSDHMKRQMEVIEWLDHCGGQRDYIWIKAEDVMDLTPAHVISVGFVVKEETDYLILIPHSCEDDCYGELLILKSTITRREILKAVPA